jgi:hypothetical protein
MDWSAIANLGAIVIGPIAAVVITRLMDNRQAVQNRRYQVFRDLMRTRAAKLSPEHVAALNLVEIEFQEFPEVNAAWHNYMENLATNIPVSGPEHEHFFVRREQLFIKLLQVVSRRAGISVDITDAMLTNYYPVGWQTEQQEQQMIRQGLIQVLSGTKPLIVKEVDPTEWSGPFPPAIQPGKSPPRSSTNGATPPGP